MSDYTEETDYTEEIDAPMSDPPVDVKFEEIMRLGEDLFGFLDKWKDLDTKRIKIEKIIKQYMIDNKIPELNFGEDCLTISSRKTKKLDESAVPEEHKKYIIGKMYIMNKRKTDPFE